MAGGPVTCIPSYVGYGAQGSAIEKPQIIYFNNITITNTYNYTSFHCPGNILPFGALSEGFDADVM